MDEATANQTATTSSPTQTTPETATDPGTPVTLPDVTGDGNVLAGSTETETPTGDTTPTLDASSPGIENTEPLILEPEVPITQPNPDN